MSALPTSQLFDPSDPVFRVHVGGKLGVHATSDLRDAAWAHLSQIPVADIPAALVPAFLPAALVAPMLKRLEQSAVDPFSTRPLAQWRRQWILWRAARDPRRIAGSA